MAKTVDIQKMVDLMSRLRGPDGCPWDKEQDRETLKPMLIEEAYEVVDAIDSGDPQELCEELGDLLLQVVFHCQIAAENQEFTLAEVIDHLHDKLVRRHPHVFGDALHKTSEEVLKHWEEIKAAERQMRGEEAAKPAKGSLLEGTPKGLPPLLEAHQLTSKAARVGFDWTHVDPIVDKFREELQELHQAADSGDREKMADEVGDLLFAVVNLARFLRVDPESALKRSNRKFTRRFRYVEDALKQRGKTLQQSSLEEMDTLWEEAKKAEPETLKPET
ncbi:MAG: nucleoside triphosphate pyrophosphohydrolase [Acidobacteria bacterium]|nr:nucleoside triphosphate pyrophosphohydrolase [Acidobacteriota bacterium]